MPPRARNNLPEFLTSDIVGELVAASLEEAATGDRSHVEPGAPALTPTERAHRSLLNRAAAEIRQHHAPDDGLS